MTDLDREAALDETQRVPTPTPAAMPSPPPAVEAAPPPAAVQPVVTPRRGATVRWAIAGAAILLIVAAAAGATMLLTGRAADPVAYTYLPADSALVLEVRPDLPGDQREKFAKLLTKFPGFADQSALPQKIDEVLDRLSDAAADRNVDYATEVKPFLGGPIVIAVTRVPQSPDTASLAGIVGILTVDEGSTCATRLGTVVESQDYKGHTISTIDKAGHRIACAVDGRQLLAGDVTDVQLALDTRSGSQSLAGDVDLKLARTKLAGDSLGLVFVSRAGMTELTQLAKQAPNASAMPSPDPATLPAWLLAALRVEDKGLLLDMLAPMPAAMTASGSSPAPSFPAAKTSTLAAKLPASTVAAVELRSLGTTLDMGLTRLRTDPKAADALKQVDLALAVLGGRAKLTGWMGDAAVAVTKTGDTYTGGLVVETPKPDDAQATFTQLRTLLALGGGSGFTVDEQPYGSGTITTITIDLQQLAPLAGVQSFGKDLPPTVAISYSVQNGVVALGIGPDFVKAVVDTQAGQSLADQPRYKDALALVGASNSGQAYVDLSAGIKAFETIALPQASDAERSQYQHDVQPYLAPLDAAAWSATVDGGYAHLRFGLTAHEAQSQ